MSVKIKCTSWSPLLRSSPPRLPQHTLPSSLHPPQPSASDSTVSMEAWLSRGSETGHYTSAFRIRIRSQPLYIPSQLSKWTGSDVHLLTLPISIRAPVSMHIRILHTNISQPIRPPVMLVIALIFTWEMGLLGEQHNISLPAIKVQ